MEPLARTIVAHRRWLPVLASGAIAVGGIVLEPGEYEFRMVSSAQGAASTLPGNAGVVVLDTTVTPELETEGVARDLVRVVQQARRDAGLAISDRIRLHVTGPKHVVAAFEAHRGLVTGETLAVEATATVGEADEPVVEVAKA